MLNEKKEGIKNLSDFGRSGTIAMNAFAPMKIK
jgi:hypothetical protein